MPRIIVMSETDGEPGGPISLDERVTSTDLDSGHHSAQLIERVGWALSDAEEIERDG